MTKEALCIGINNYPGTQNDLAGCVNDANDWKASLEIRGFGVRQLINRQATKRAIEDAILKLVRQAQSGDIAVITYSGHGSWVPDMDGDEDDGRDEVLCPYDIAENRPIKDDELYDLFAQRNAGSRIVLISDSCHSGTLIDPRPRERSMVSRGGPRYRFLPPGFFLSEAELKVAQTTMRRRRLDAASRSFGGVLLSGCQDREVSWDTEFEGRANGAFTYFALRALERIPAGASYRDWYNEVRETLPNEVFPQTPNLLGTRSQKAWKIFD